MSEVFASSGLFRRFILKYQINSDTRHAAPATAPMLIPALAPEVNEECATAAEVEVDVTEARRELRVDADDAVSPLSAVLEIKAEDEGEKLADREVADAVVMENGVRSLGAGA